MEYLTFEEIIELHAAILQPGEPNGFDEHHLRSIIGTVEVGAFDQLYHPTILEAGGAYLFYFARNQVFANGNKRTGVITCTTFMYLNDSPLLVPIEPSFVAEVAAVHRDKDFVFEYLRKLQQSGVSK